MRPFDRLRDRTQSLRTAFVCHISCQSGKWQGFVSRGDKVTQRILWGITGLEATQAVADACTFLTSLPFAIWIIRKLNAKSQRNAWN